LVGKAAQETFRGLSLLAVSATARAAAAFATCGAAAFKTQKAALPDSFICQEGMPVTG